MRWQAEQIECPGLHDLFKLRGYGRHDLHSSILVPCSGQPARSESGWKASTDDKSKVPGSGCGDGCGRAELVQPCENLLRFAGFIRKRAAQNIESRKLFGFRGDLPGV